MSLCHSARRVILGRYLSTSATPNVRKGPTSQPLSLRRVSQPTGSQRAETKPPEDSKRLLQPYTLSLRLKKLCGQGQLDAALDMLRNAARGAQNTKVWNTLISEYLNANKFRAAYSLFVDMKRRGYKPNTMTFQTMFSGFSRVSAWEGHPKRLASVHALYDHFLRHLESLKDVYPQSRNLTVSPLASYIKILGDVGDYQRMFDVYYALDQHSALAPNEFIFAAMFQVISERQTPSSSSDHPSIHVQNASDTRLLWRQMLKVAERSPGFLIDSHILTPAILALSRGRTVDQDFALDIVKGHLGLARSKDAIPRNPCLTPSSLNAALWLCIHMRKYELCLEIFQQATDYHTKADAIIDRGHVEAAFRALDAVTTPGSKVGPHRALQILEWTLKQEMTGAGGPRILPTVTTYNMLLLVCWRGGDWPTAIRIFELMMGYSAKDFEDGQDSSKEPIVQKRSDGRNLTPDAQTMQYIIRTASVTRNTAHMRQSLRFVERVGIQTLFGFAPPMDPRQRQRPSPRQVELARVIKEAVDHVSNNSPKPSVWDKNLWNVLRSRASDVLRWSSKEGGQAVLKVEKSQAGEVQYDSTACTYRTSTRGKGIKTRDRDGI